MPVSLHTHSWYSLLEGASSLESLVDRAAACGHDSLALTDTNNLYGAVPFTKLAWARGVRPLLGACLRQQRSRCVALIAEPAGYRNLCRVLSRLHLEGGARLTDLLAAHAEGLHVLADEAVTAERLREAFGNRLWLEVVRPPRSPRHERDLLEAGRRLGLEPVASTAAHFATAADYPAFRLATAVRQGALLDRLPARFPVTPEHHLVEPAALRQRFRDLPRAVRNTDVLAEQLRAGVLPYETVLPEPRVPRRLGAAAYLRRLCERGLERRGLAGRPDARERLAAELAVTTAGGLEGYFLVVRDIARHARRRGHGMALRGSAGNSLVCYLLEITDVDPLRFGLPLERFLHPGRAELPDIDLDFDWKVRDEVLAYVFRRHGPRHTAMISSHLFLQPRSTLREAAKAHGLSNEQVSRLLDSGPRRVEELVGEGQLPGEGCPVPPGFPLEPERWPRILADAAVLLGRPHHLSIHPGGVVITPRPVEEYVPLQRAAKGVVITQFEKDAAEAVGLVKIDLLGNRALGTVDEALAHCRAQADAYHCPPRSPDTPRSQTPFGNAPLETPFPACYPRPGAGNGVSGNAFPNSVWERAGGKRAGGERGGEEPGIGGIAEPDIFDDPATLDLLRRADTLGVNQLESPAMRHLLVQLQPRGLEDVVRALALIRPGATGDRQKECFVRRRRGLDPVPRLHPRVDDLLAPTEGVLVYEDDALRVIQALTGLPTPEADRFRRRVAKHRTPDEARALAEEFVRACARDGVPPAVAEALWPQLAKFHRYAFCKSHAVSYALIAWRAAWLKTHHPVAFWAAALNNNQGVYPRRVYVEAVKRAGIPLRLPCVNRSEGPFTPEDGALRVGLDAVAHLDEELRQAVVGERRRHGPYRDLADFRRRVRPGPEALAALVRCGALDFTGRCRPALFLEADLEDAEDRGRPDARFLFDRPPADWEPADYPALRRLRDEWQALGFVVGPPLLSLFRPRLPPGLTPSRELADRVGRPVRVAGLVATARHTPTLDGRSMYFVTLEDEDGLAEVTLFPDVGPPAAYLSLGPYLACGTVDCRYGAVAVNAREFRRVLP